MGITFDEASSIADDGARRGERKAQVIGNAVLVMQIATGQVGDVTAARQRQVAGGPTPVSD
jgi:hypothetical protein